MKNDNIKISYNNLKYLSQRRFHSIYEQMATINSLVGVDSVLEIGSGSGILGYLLKELGYSYKSLDNNNGLKSDIVADIRNIPCDSNSFNAVACFQVLEHLPYSDFELALDELIRVSSRYILISLPIKGIYWTYSIYLPGIGHKRLIFKRPFQRIKSHTFDGEHYWELESTEVSLSNFLDKVRSKCTILKHWQCFNNPYHYFIIIEK